MSVRTDRVNLVVTINGDEAQKQYTELESKATRLRAELRGLTKDSKDYARTAGELKAVEQEMDAIRGKTDVTRLTLRQLRTESRRLRQIRDNLQPGTREFEALNARINQVNARMGELTGRSRAAGTAVQAEGKRIGSVLDGVRSAIPGAALFGGVAAGAAVLTQQVTNFLGQARQMALQAEGIEAAFARLNDPALLDRLQDAVRGTQSELSLMQLAVQADNFRIPMDVLETGLRFAQKQAVATGQSVDFLTNSFVTGLGRKSPQILDNLGISMVELNEKIAELGDFNEAVIAVVNEKLGEMGDTVLTAGEKADQATARFQDMQKEVGEKVNVALDELLALLLRTADELEALFADDLGDLVANIRDFAGSIQELKDSILPANTELNLFSKWLALTTIVPRTAIKGLNAFADAYRFIAERVREASLAITDFLNITNEQERTERRLADERAAREQAEAERQKERLRLLEELAARFEAQSQAEVNSLSALRDRLKQLRDEYEQTAIGSARYVELARQIKEVEEEIASADLLKKRQEQKKAIEGEAGSLAVLTAQLQELAKGLSELTPGTDAYVAQMQRMADKAREVAAAQQAATMALRDFNRERFGTTEEDSRRQVQTMEAEGLATRDLTADIEAHGAARGEMGVSLDYLNEQLQVQVARFGAAKIGSEEYENAASKITDLQQRIADATKTANDRINESAAAYQAVVGGLEAIVMSILQTNATADEATVQGIQQQLAISKAAIFFARARAIGDAIAGASSAAAAGGPAAPFLIAGYIASMVGAVVSGIAEANKAQAVAEQQIAGIREQRQFAEGGYDLVRGADDGRVYKARRSAQAGGRISGPTLTRYGALAGERGPEYYVSHEMMRNPVVMRTVEMLENIRVSRQFAAGGFDRAVPSPAAPPAMLPGEGGMPAEMGMALMQMLERLNDQLEQGIEARYSDREVRRLRRVSDRQATDEARGRF